MPKTSAWCSLLIFILAMHVTLPASFKEPQIGLPSNSTIEQFERELVKSTAQQITEPSDALLTKYVTEVAVTIAKGANVTIQTKTAAKDNQDDGDTSVLEVIPLRSDSTAVAVHPDNADDEKEVETNLNTEQNLTKISESVKEDVTEVRNESREKIEEKQKEDNGEKKQSETQSIETKGNEGNVITQSTSTPTTVTGAKTVFTADSEKETALTYETSSITSPTEETKESSSTQSAPSTTLTSESSSSESAATNSITATTSTATTTMTTNSTSSIIENETTTKTSSTEQMTTADNSHQSEKSITDAGEGMSSGIIALVMAIVFAVVVIFVYVGLLIWRRYLEYRYGNRELLVNDLEFDTSDLRHFEL